MLTIAYCPKCYQKGFHLPPFYLSIYEQLVEQTVKNKWPRTEGTNYYTEELLASLEELNFITTMEIDNGPDLLIRINGIKRIRDDAFEICLNPFEHNIKFDIYE